MRRVGKISRASPRLSRSSTSLAVSHAAPAHSPAMTLGCQSPAGAARDKEHRIEAPDGVKFRHPAREGRERVTVEHQGLDRASSCANGRVGDQHALKLSAAAWSTGIGASPTGTAVSSIVSRIAATTAASSRVARRARGRQGSIRPPGKTSAPAANAMPCRPLDHQQFGQARRR